jgi:transmembrane sensor
MGFFGLWMLMAPTHYATGIGQTREIRLSDGSEVTLGARSSLDVTFRTEERRVALTAGEAFFSVTKNAARPFIVVVGDKQVRVVGTKFEVWRDTSEMRVSVVEGIVEVTQPPTTPMTASAPPARLQAESAHTAAVSVPQTAVPPSPSVVARAPVLMAAGQQVTAELSGAIEDPQAMPRGEPAAWRHGRLVYLDAPLREIIADANRYSRERIEITDDNIADLRVSLTYPSDRIDQMLAALSRSLHLEIEHSSSGGILLKATGRSE